MAKSTAPTFAQMVIALQNTTATSRFLRVLPPSSPYFALGLGKYQSTLPHDDVLCPGLPPSAALVVPPAQSTAPLLPPIKVPESCQCPCPPHLAQGTGSASLPPFTLWLPLTGYSSVLVSPWHPSNQPSSFSVFCILRPPLVIPALGRIDTNPRPVWVEYLSSQKNQTKPLCHLNTPISKVCPQDHTYGTGPGSLHPSIPHGPSHSCLGLDVVTYAWRPACPRQLCLQPGLGPAVVRVCCMTFPRER